MGSLREEEVKVPLQYTEIAAMVPSNAFTKQFRCFRFTCSCGKTIEKTVGSYKGSGYPIPAAVEELPECECGLKEWTPTFDVWNNKSLTREYENDSNFCTNFVLRDNYCNRQAFGRTPDWVVDRNRGLMARQREIQGNVAKANRFVRGIGYVKAPFPKD